MGGSFLMVLLDTCALIWWTLDPDQLSPKARKACDGILRSGGIVSSISIWEIGIKIKNGKLEIGLSLEEYVARVKKIEKLSILPVDEAIWMKNLSLPWKQRDPADRTIVATAALNHVPIITKDDPIAKFYKKVIW
jgi:PIN domain nuclease of toxin-antitoxin system